MSGFISFELISDVNDQINALKLYFKQFNIHSDINDNHEWLVNIISKLDKWLESVNEQDFAHVSNAIMHYITMRFKNDHVNGACAELLKNFSLKIINNKYFRFFIDSRLSLFYMWWFSNRYFNYSLYFFYCFLIGLKVSNYNNDYLPTVNDITLVIVYLSDYRDGCENNNTNGLVFEIYSEIFCLIRLKFNTYNSIFKFNEFLVNLVNKFKNIINKDTNNKYLNEFQKFVLSFNFIHVINPAILTHEHAIFKTLLNIVESAQKGNLITKNELNFILNNNDINIIENEMRAVKLVHVVKNNSSIVYQTIMHELGLTNSEELENFLFDVNQRGIVSAKINPSMETIEFYTLTPNLIRLKNNEDYGLDFNTSLRGLVNSKDGDYEDNRSLVETEH